MTPPFADGGGLFRMISTGGSGVSERPDAFSTETKYLLSIF